MLHHSFTLIVGKFHIIHSTEIIFQHQTRSTIFVQFQQFINQNLQLIDDNPAGTFAISAIFNFSDISRF